MRKPLNVLIVEDSEVDAIVLLSLLRSGGYEPEFRRVASAEGLSTALREQKWDVVLSDHLMPHFSSEEALKLVRAADPDVPFLIVSGAIGDEVAVAAMKAGAQDYLMKTNLARLVAAVERELVDVEHRRAHRVAERALLAQEEEFRLAREVQQHLFPAVAPDLAGYDVAGASWPAAATGGDYFDYIPAPDGSLVVVVGDVTGHGLGPALLMTDARAYLRTLVQWKSSLAEILEQASRLLSVDLGEDRFITVLLVRLQPANGAVEFINAGHPAGLVLAPDGHVKTELVSSSPALGIGPHDVPRTSGRLALEPGDLVLMLSDGIVEAHAPSLEEFGEARVLDVVRRERARPAAEIIQTLLDEARRFSGRDGFADDMTAVCIKYGSSRRGNAVRAGTGGAPLPCGNLTGAGGGG